MLQIRPQYEQWEAWETLASRYGLTYEVLEISVPPLLDSATAHDRLHSWYRSSGRLCSLHGAFLGLDPASMDASHRALSRRRCRESCAVAALLGAKNVVFHSSALPHRRGAYLDAWAEECASFYDQLARNYALNLYIENCDDLDPAPLQTLMARSAPQRVNVCLSVGHAHCSPTPLAQWFAALGSRIGYLHLSDNLGVFDDRLLPGEGSVDWAEADALWRRLGGDIPLTLEADTPDGVERTLAFFRAHGLFGLAREGG